MNPDDFFDHKGKYNEKPDLQSERYGLGIEVTQAITRHDGLTNSLANQYFGRGLDGEYIVERIYQNNKKGRFHGEAYVVDGGAVISFDTSKHKDNLLASIKDKSKKFSGYKRFKTNGLYCFVHSSSIYSDQYDEIASACEASRFSLLFINCIEKIIQWERSSNSFTEYEIEENLLAKWANEAMNITSSPGL